MGSLLVGTKLFGTLQVGLVADALLAAAKGVPWQSYSSSLLWAAFGHHRRGYLGVSQRSKRLAESESYDEVR